MKFVTHLPHLYKHTHTHTGIIDSYLSRTTAITLEAHASHTLELEKKCKSVGSKEFMAKPIIIILINFGFAVQYYEGEGNSPRLFGGKHHRYIDRIIGHYHGGIGRIGQWNIPVLLFSSLFPPHHHHQTFKPFKRKSPTLLVISGSEDRKTIDRLLASWSSIAGAISEVTSGYSHDLSPLFGHSSRRQLPQWLSN